MLGHPFLDAGHSAGLHHAFSRAVTRESFAMDNQHRKISGYRELSQAEVDLMNEVKAFEARWNGLVDRLRALPALDQRNVALAVTAGEDAFMRAVRAIAQPERIVA